MLPKAVPAAKSLLVLVFVGPLGKIRLSPAEGAVSPAQLAAVLQWLSAPPPVQTSAATRVKVTSLPLAPPR